MNVDRATVSSLALTVILVVSVFPAGIVGVTENSRAMSSHSSAYTVIQGSDCWEVEPYRPGDPNPDGPPGDDTVQPHVEVVEDSEEFGSFRNASWNGSPTIESVMDYRYRDPPGGVHDNDQPWGQRPYSAPWLAEPYWKDPWSFGTYGLWNWSENQESHMFFYDGPEGDSLVMRHDKLYDDTPIGSHDPYNGRNGPHEGFMTPQPGRSAVSFVFRDLPAGEWAYMDDLYPEEMDDLYYASGEFDYVEGRHTRYGARHNDYGAAPLENYSGGTAFTVHWMWGENGTDGGAYRGLQNLDAGERVVVEPYFDENSYFWSERPWRYNRSDGDGITDWVVRRKNGENVHLDKDQPVEILRGSHCPDASFRFGTNADEDRVEVGEQFALDARASEGTGIRYNWDLDGDGEFEVRNGTDPTLLRTYDGNVTGEVSVTLLVEDGQGIQNAVTKQIRVVPREPPRPNVTVAGTDLNSLKEHHVVDETLTFDATNTTDNGAINVSSAVWRVDGNVTARGQLQYEGAFGETGEYEVSFAVSDEAGLNATRTTTVEVVDLDTEDPDASAEVTPREVEAGANVTFDASGSDDNRGIAAYRWDFDGDGTYDATTRDSSFERTPYGAQGAHNVTLQVADANGNTDNATVPVTVLERRPPNVTDWRYPERAVAGQSIELDAEATDNGNVAEYRWEINGEVVTGKSASYTFEENITRPRNISVRLVVVDRAGAATATSEATIRVLPGDGNPPDASLSVSTNETKVGNSVTFDANESTDPPHHDIAAYRWDFDGDGSTDETTEDPVVAHEYDAAGTYNATVIVEDGSGNEGSATVGIEVAENEQAKRDSSGGSSSTSGSGMSTGPPPVDTDVERTGPNAVAIDVQNGRADEVVRSDLPASEVASETGVRFRSVAIDLAGDDPHVVFRTAASAEPPENVPALTATDRTLAYLDLDASYLDDEVSGATVEFTVQRSALGELAAPSDVSVYRFDGSWEQVNATVVGTTDDAYRLEATAERLGTLAVGADRSIAVADVELAADTVTTGETVTATAAVENVGADSRDVTVNLTLDGNVVASETVEVPAGETREVTLNGTAPTPGTYEAAVGGTAAGTLAVEEVRPADVSVVDVALNESTISAGERVAITATVENAGGEPGEETVVLTLFGEELDRETVDVPGGETKQVTFVRRIDADGTYTVDVNGETVELEVTATGGGDDLAEKAPSVPGFGVGAALAALLAVALLVRSRD